MAKSARRPRSATSDGRDGPRPPVRRPRRAARRRRHPRGVLRRRRPLDEQFDGARARLAALADRDRALARRLVATVLRRLGTLAPSASAACLDRGLPPRRRGSRPRCWSAPRKFCCSRCRTMPRSILRCGWSQADREAARYAGLVNAVLRRVARTARNALAALDAAALDTPDWLLARWTHDLWRGDRARDRRGQRPRAGARPHREKRPRILGGEAERPCAADRHGAHHRAWRGHRAARLCRRRVVGTGCRGRAAGASVRRRCAAAASPIFARRRAARRRSSPPPARASPPSTARRRGMTRLADNLTRLSLAAELVCADAADWQAGAHSTPCCSMRRAPRPAPSAAIPTFPGSSSEADIVKLAGVATPSDRARRGADHSPAARWSIAPVRSSRRRTKTIVADLLARDKLAARAARGRFGRCR